MKKSITNFLKSLKNTKAFTLVELVVVITTIAFVGYQQYFGITTSGFDHHSINYYMLNSGCVNHYIYEYNFGGYGYKQGGCDMTGISIIRLSYFVK
ncbi:MAG: hypothetical protein PHE25_03855 [Candidatus Gracilibacteria bacterium]|nr:hypothetical protein [Candidatus Gracilibacteria bacterium]